MQRRILNNLRLIVQPKIFLCLISPRLEVFPIPNLVKGFLVLIGILNQFKPYLPDGSNDTSLLFTFGE